MAKSRLRKKHKQAIVKRKNRLAHKKILAQKSFGQAIQEHQDSMEDSYLEMKEKDNLKNLPDEEE